MKCKYKSYFLAVLFLFASGSVAADYTTYSSGGSVTGSSSSSKIDKLKQYVIKGRELVNKFEGLLNQYEQTLDRVKIHKNNCKINDSYYKNRFNGTIFDNRDVCNGKLELLVGKLKNQAGRLDNLEQEMLDVKENIQSAQANIGILGSMGSVTEATNKMDNSIDKFKQKQEVANDMMNGR